jgi:hypothetical protein
MSGIEPVPLDRDRLLIVQDPGNLTRFVRARYPQFEVSASPSYLEGIAALAGRPTRAVLVGVDPAARKLREAVAGIRRAAGVSGRVILCCHPGGVKVIDAIESALELNQGELNLEREVLNDYGNMSAPTVMFVLDRLLKQGLPDRVLMTAFGPGFTCAGLMLEAV